MSSTVEQTERIKEIWINKAKALGYNAAAELMSSLYQVDFEAYMIAFELCDSQGKTLDYFSFPIMPTELSINEELPVKVESTFGGVNTTSSNIFVPKNITLRGNFGRQFKMLWRNKLVLPIYQSSGNQVIQERDYGANKEQRLQIQLSNIVKTGFGCFKVLQSIINRSVEIDDSGECNRLYMYNMAYGESYLVKALSFTGNQNLSQNGIWNYDLSLKAVCPLHLDAFKNGKTFKSKASSLIKNVGQSALSGILSGARQTFNINN